jgi:hypothetical protein
MKHAWVALTVMILVFAPVFTLNAQEIEWKRLSDNAPWSPRDSGGLLVFKGKMWILGGWTIGLDQKFHRLNDVWSSSDGISWEQVLESAPWKARNLAGAVVFKDKMWIMGGSTGTESLGDIWFSSDGKTWTQSSEPVPWKPRLAFGCAVYKDKLWVIGGMDMKTDWHANDVWSSSDGIHWTRVTENAPWGPRAMFPLVELNGKLWLFGGGVYDKKSQNYHDVWNSEDGLKWLRVTDDAGWAERRFHVITSYRNKLWLFGGVTDGNVNLNDVWNTSDGINWAIVNKSAPWGVRHAQLCGVFDDAIWMIGGFSGDVAGERLYQDIWKMMWK